MPKTKIDFDDEAAVVAVIAGEFDVEPEDIEDEIEVEEDELYGYDVWRVTVGGEEYILVPDYDTAVSMAEANVRETLETEPEIFNQDWLLGHINEQKLSDWVYQANMEDEYAEEISDDPERFWSEYESWGLGRAPEEDEDGDLPEPDNEAIEALREAIAKEKAKDPMDWLSDIWGDEAMAKALDVAGIDIDAAAEDAVSQDGWEHFLSRHDGDSHTTEQGWVYWKES